jgi:hypothetical protein
MLVNQMVHPIFYGYRRFRCFSCLISCCSEPARICTKTFASHINLRCGCNRFSLTLGVMERIATTCKEGSSVRQRGVCAGTRGELAPASAGCSNAQRPRTQVQRERAKTQTQRYTYFHTRNTFEHKGKMGSVHRQLMHLPTSSTYTANSGVKLNKC